MKHKKLTNIDYIYLGFLFVFTFLLFTLPIKDDPLPFGEGDAAQQFGRADWISYSDKIDSKMPHHIAIWYWRMNPKDPYAVLYPTPAFVNQALFQVFTGERFLSITYYYAVTCFFLMALAIFWMMRNVIGFYQALIASFFGIFAAINVTSYIWGQRLVMVALVYVPITVFTFYKYCISHLAGQEKRKYLVLSSLFLIFGGIFHAQAIILSALIIICFLTFMLIKYRKIPFSIKGIAIFSLVFLIGFSPFLPNLMGQSQAKSETGFGIHNPGDLLSWFKLEDNFPNREIHTPTSMALVGWFIPFIFLGMFFLLFNKKDSNLLLLALLVGTYFSVHSYVFGILSYGRMTRILKFSPYVFSIFYSIGFLGLVSLIKSKQMRKWGKLALTLALFAFLFSTVYPSSKQNLENAYPAPLRVNQAEIEAANWLSDNTAYTDNIRLRGTITYPKTGFFWMSSHRPVYAMFYGYNNDSEHGNDNRNYAIFDFSDLEMLKDHEQFFSLYKETKEIESKLDNSRIVYDKKNIRIYDVRGISDEVW